MSEAVASAPEGSTIRVMSGIYSEVGILIDKPLTLLGEGRPVIDANSREEDVIAVRKTHDVRVSGLRILNSGFSYLKEVAAIKVEDSREVKVEDNELKKVGFGIYVANSENCIFQRNSVSGILRLEANTGNGIHIWHGKGHVIEGNRISETRDGIYLEFVNDSRIASNQVDQSLRYGLHFMESNRNAFRDNRFEKNGAGVAVMYSREIVMERNQFVQNSGASAYGVLLKEISGSKIKNNAFDGNTVGIYMEGCNRSEFSDNQIVRNAWGLRLMGSCDGNRFEHNDFVDNTFDVTTNSSFNTNEFVRNYWSDYDGYDLNHDGFGDRPFRLGSLSSIILDRVDSSFILIHSFLFSLLDQTERALPELIPERLRDEQPLVKPWSYSKSRTEKL